MLHMEKNIDQISFTCSSNQVHNSADCFESFAAEVASPTRAHGMRYYYIGEKNASIDYSIYFTFGTKDLPFRSTLLLEVMYQPTIASKRQTKVNIGRQPKA